jgi:hypothetical protein
MIEDRPYNDSYVAAIREVQSVCKEIMTENKSLSEDKSFDQAHRLQFQQRSITYRVFGIILSTVETNMNLINHLWNERDKTATKEELDKIRADLANQASETLGPIKEEYDKLKEIRQRGEDSDAYH